MAFGVAVFNDLLDLSGVGSTPVVGDVIDLGTSALLWRALGTRKTLPTLLEFVPGFDYLPIYTMTVTGSYVIRQERPEKGMRKIEIR